jgi:hypothetical protein
VPPQRLILTGTPAPARPDTTAEPSARADQVRASEQVAMLP